MPYVVYTFLLATQYVVCTYMYSYIPTHNIYIYNKYIQIKFKNNVQLIN